MNELKKIRVIGFIKKIEKDVVGPVPDDYMKGSTEIPQILIEELKANGWTNRSGLLGWSQDFEPAPVVGDDGHVYLLLSDADVEDKVRCARRMNEAKVLLMSHC